MFLKGFFYFPVLCLTMFVSSVFAQSLPPVDNSAPKQEVSDKDLEMFVEIYKIIQEENEKLQQEMMGVVEEGGMTVERFNEVYQAQMQPDSGADISKKEQEQMQEIMAEIQTAQVAFQEKVAEIIEENGMSLEKYEAVFMELQQNQELQMKFGELMQG